MASVKPFTNPSGDVRWRVQYRIDGNGRQETFDTSEAAYAYGNLVDKVGGKAAKEVLERRRENDRNVPTLREWTERFLDPSSGILTGIEPGTRAGYRAIARASFLNVLGDYPLDAIGKDDVGKWVDWQEKQPSKRTKGQTVAAKTVRNYHALLSNALKAAEDAGLIKGNPAYKTRMSRGLAREAVFLSREEFAALYECIPDHYRPLVAFLAASQARWGEATALTWGDLNRDTIPPTVRIVKAWKKNPGGKPVISVTKTPKGRRTVSLWPAIVAALGNPGAPGDLIFQGKLNHERIWYGPFNTRIWKPAVEKAQLGKSPNIHDLRHTGASWLIADGQPLPFIQARLGHEKITTTIETYGHLLPDSHTKMSTSLSGIMSNVLPPLTPIEAPSV